MDITSIALAANVLVVVAAFLLGRKSVIKHLPARDQAAYAQGEHAGFHQGWVAKEKSLEQFCLQQQEVQKQAKLVPISVNLPPGQGFGAN